MAYLALVGGVERLAEEIAGEVAENAAVETAALSTDKLARPDRYSTCPLSYAWTPSRA